MKKGTGSSKAKTVSMQRKMPQPMALARRPRAVALANRGAWGVDHRAVRHENAHHAKDVQEHRLAVAGERRTLVGLHHLLGEEAHACEDSGEGVV